MKVNHKELGGRRAYGVYKIHTVSLFVLTDSFEFLFLYEKEKYFWCEKHFLKGFVRGLSFIVWLLVIGSYELYGAFIESFPFFQTFVRPSVRYQLSSEAKHRIALIFCIKLAFKQDEKSDEARFLKKKLFGPNLGNLGPNLPKFELFGQIIKFESLNFSDFAYFYRKTGYMAARFWSNGQKMVQIEGLLPFSGDI